MKNNTLYTLSIGTSLLISLQPGMANIENKENLKPNVVCILVDDLGYGDLSCQGAKDIRTPNIDNLMKQGKRFTSFYANCPVCSPTRASLLTGCYPDMVGVPGVIRTNPEDSWGYLSSEAIMLPSLLKNSGYNTALIGKWHLGLELPDTPNERGFDFFHGFLGDMMDDYYTHLRGGINYLRYNNKEISPEGHATDLFTEWAIVYIQEQSISENPFFLYLAYNAPHTPIQPPADWLEKVKKREKGINDKRAKLVALIEHLDNGIGKVIDVLENSGIMDNTIIIFSSDNGGQLNVGANNGNLRGGKQNMYEGGIRVPACIVWKDKIKPGTVTDRFALTMDICPTLCEIIGITIDHKIDGISILPTLFGKEQITDARYTFWMRREGWQYGGQIYYAARYKSYKIVQNTPYEDIQFFNLKEDPKEEKPLNKNQKEYKILFKELQNHIRKAGAIPWQKYEPLKNDLN